MAAPESSFGASGLSDDLDLTRFVANVGRSIDFSLLPADAQQRTKHCFLDTLGCALLGSQYDAARIAQRVLFSHGGDSGPSTVFGTAARRGAPIEVALVNGIAAHVMDFDDTNRPGETGHPSCAVSVAAFAVAEMVDASGSQLLGAITAGYETAVRIGQLMGTEHYDTGFHTTGTIGTFSSAAACAHLLGLELNRWIMALGIAGTQAAGLRASFGTMAKSLHAGRAASAGVLAALLAQEGFTGSERILEGEHGFVWAHTPTAYPGFTLRPLADPYFVMDNKIKYHAACGGTHDAIDAAKLLRTENEFSSRDIERVTVRAPERFLRLCNIQSPRNGLEAKFSLRFTTAAGLLGWNTDESGFVDNAKIVDPEIVNVIDRTTVESAQLETRHGPTEVQLTLKDGRRLSASHSRGAPMPWPTLDAEWNFIAEKFVRLTHSVLGERFATLVVERVHALEEEESIRAFGSWLAAGSRAN